MTDKIIAMPTDDELFEAFAAAVQAGTPENKKDIAHKFEGFMEKGKEHLKTVITLDAATGLSLNFTEATGNELLEGFIHSQSFILRTALKAVLAVFGADTFTHLVESTKSGKNGKDATVNGFAAILTHWFATLGEKYAVTETAETIKAKVDAVFA